MRRTIDIHKIKYHEMNSLGSIIIIKISEQKEKKIMQEKRENIKKEQIMDQYQINHHQY